MGLRFWRDPDGPEVDWVVVTEDRWLPVDAKWSDAPGEREARHLQIFMSEYSKASMDVVFVERRGGSKSLRRSPLCLGSKFPSLWRSWYDLGCYERKRERTWVTEGTPECLFEAPILSI